MQFKADMHMHTQYSDGRGTMKEMMSAGLNKGLDKIAITEHGPNNIGVGIKSAEQLLDIKKEALELSAGQNIQVLVGVEADVIGTNGEIDVPQSIYQQLDLLLVGLHPHVIPVDVEDGLSFILPNKFFRFSSGVRKRVIRNNTNAIIEVLNKHKVDILTHPGLNMPIDYEAVAKVCAEKGTLYEINTGHNDQHFQTISIINTVASSNVNFIINSDAHYPETVGELKTGWALLKMAGVSPERVVNVRH